MCIIYDWFEWLASRWIFISFVCLCSVHFVLCFSSALASSIHCTEDSPIHLTWTNQIVFVCVAEQIFFYFGAVIQVVFFFLFLLPSLICYANSLTTPIEWKRSKEGKAQTRLKQYTWTNKRVNKIEQEREIERKEEEKNVYKKIGWNILRMQSSYDFCMITTKMIHHRGMNPLESILRDEITIDLQPSSKSLYLNK